MVVVTNRRFPRKVGSEENDERDAQWRSVEVGFLVIHETGRSSTWASMKLHEISLKYQHVLISAGCILDS